MDVLSNIIQSIHLSGSFWCRTEATAPWAIRIDTMDFAHFRVVRRGNCWFDMDDLEAPLQLSTGDLVFLPHGHAHTLSDDPQTSPVPICELINNKNMEPTKPLRLGGQGTAATLLCGCCRYERSEIHPLFSVLPSLIYLQGDDKRNLPWLETTLDYISNESCSSRPGAETIINRLVDVLIIQLIRIHIESLPDSNTGWMRGLKDPQIAKSLGYIHQHPEQAWTVESLSSAVGMSGASFAAKFRQLVGETPHQYITGWRMHKASKVLKQSTHSLAIVAAQVGYQTEAAFSKVFKRFMGISPSRYRRISQIQG